MMQAVSLLCLGIFQLHLMGCSIAPDAKAPTASGPTEPTALNEYKNMPVSEFAKLYQAGGVQLVDVRTQQAFKEGHVPGAVNIPIEDFDPNHLGMFKFDRQKPVYLICRTGALSGRAAQQMAAAGREAINIEGGISQWITAGHSVE